MKPRKRCPACGGRLHYVTDWHLVGTALGLVVCEVGWWALGWLDDLITGIREWPPGKKDHE